MINWYPGTMGFSYKDWVGHAPNQVRQTENLLREHRVAWAVTE